jgi:Diacylglycerol kinase catalytic domain
MVTTEAQAPGGTTFIQRWLARLAFVAAAAAVLVPPLSAGARHSLALTLFGVAGLIVTVAALWWALAYKGPVRWLAVALAVAVPLGVLALYTSYRQVRFVVLSLGLLAVALAAGRAALRRDAIPERMREHQVPPPRRPFLIMNPRSGGGKVTRFGLKDKAEALGATVALLEGPGPVDVAALARQAVADGADLLGVAGGDGTQALVAGIAAEHDLPLLVISAGTRNHFALDLGLDRDDPSRCLDALRDGVELRVDLGVIADRPFVNNASFGAYAGGGAEPGLPRRQAQDHPGPTARAAGRPAGATPGGQGGERDHRRAAGGAGLQQRLWHGRHRRVGPSGPAGPRQAGPVRGHRHQHCPGGRAAGRNPLARADQAGGS